MKFVGITTSSVTENFVNYYGREDCINKCYTTINKEDETSREKCIKSCAYQK